MKRLSIFSFLIVMFGLVVFTGNETPVSAAELEEEPALTFDITKDEFQETSYVDEEGNEVTLSIEPVIKQETGNYSTQASDAQYSFPYGTSSYKVKGTNGMLTATYYVDVNVPRTNINNSTIKDAYDENYFCFGCEISSPDLDFGSKWAEFTCTTTFLGLTSNFNKLRVELEGNMLHIYRQF